MPGITGGAFIISEGQAQDAFTPEDLSEEHRAIGRAADEFWANEVDPHLDAIQHQEPGVALAVLRKSAELGLTSIEVPEEYLSLIHISAEYAVSSTPNAGTV